MDKLNADIDRAFSMLVPTEEDMNSIERALDDIRALIAKSLKG